MVKEMFSNILYRFLNFGAIVSLLYSVEMANMPSFVMLACVKVI